MTLIKRLRIISKKQTKFVYIRSSERCGDSLRQRYYGSGSRHSATKGTWVTELCPVMMLIGVT